MKKLHIRASDVAFIALATVLLVIGVWIAMLGPADPINKNQICSDLVSIVNDTSNPRAYADMFSRAYLVVQEDDGGYEIRYSKNGVEAEVWISVPMDPETEIWVCLVYDVADASHRRYKMYDYGYMLK